MFPLVPLSFVLAVAGFTQARPHIPRQLSHTPSCGTRCFAKKITEWQSLAGQCSGPSNYSCFCNTSTFNQAYINCVNDHCTGADVADAISGGQTFCANIQAGSATSTLTGPSTTIVVAVSTPAATSGYVTDTLTTTINGTAEIITTTSAALNYTSPAITGSLSSASISASIANATSSIARAINASSAGLVASYSIHTASIGSADPSAQSRLSSELSLLSASSGSAFQSISSVEASISSVAAVSTTTLTASSSAPSNAKGHSAGYLLDSPGPIIIAIAGMINLVILKL